MNRHQRNEFVSHQITKLEDLLEQWERFQVTARDPGEKEHSKIEIQRLKQLISEYESELKGGAIVDENMQAPLIAPAIRKNNRKWLLGIVIALLLIGVSSFFYLKSTEIIPDYSKYLSYLSQGDSLVKVNNYPAAKVSYKKALQYNPGDSAVIKKISYLKKADDLVAQNKFTEAKSVFKIIVDILPSAGLSSKAIAIKGNNADEKNTGNLQFNFEWKDGMLVIKVSGGTPFQGNGNAPYKIEGLDCEDCVQWINADNWYIGKVPHEKVNSFSISVKDSKGVTTAVKQVPAYTGATQTPSAVTKSDNTAEENYTALVEEADKNFADNKFEQALANYVAAVAIKPATKDLGKKIEECNKRINEQKFIAAKNIPRVSIAGNSFTMGFEDGLPGERPEHTVKLSPFDMGKTEVTVAQYRAYCGFANKTMPPTPAGGWIEDNPITNVTWVEAKSYCEWVGGRLPTEAEWEYAAKEAGTSSKNYSGSNDLGRVAVYKDNSGNRPGNVGRKQPNSLGLYDMTGNVFEWCSDWYKPNYYAASDPVNPRGPANGIEKVIRGGAFNSFTESTQDGNQLRVTYRNQTEPSARENYIGFRVLWEK